jgi:hypothetical protein
MTVTIVVWVSLLRWIVGAIRQLPSVQICTSVASGKPLSAHIFRLSAHVGSSGAGTESSPAVYQKVELDWLLRKSGNPVIFDVKTRNAAGR